MSGDAAGIERLPALVDPVRCAAWEAAAASAIESARARGEARDGWSPTSSSLRLACVPAFDLAVLLDVVAHPALVAACTRVLGTDDLACSVEQSWWRRQYPVRAAPAGHHPHGWHQDGALGHDFMARPDGGGPGDVLDMATCWIALVPCGIDAPGLELVEGSPRRLLGLGDLDAAERLSEGTAEGTAGTRIRPALSAGDALVFGGAVLHRTHVTQRMTRVRTSFELRFFARARQPIRLGADDGYAHPGAR
jgi:hypothetical protein